MPDPEGYRAAKEARVDLAKRATGGATRTGEETATRLVNVAVYRYEHQEHGHHHHGAEPEQRG
jgi:hypothetical protein